MQLVKKFLSPDKENEGGQSKVTEPKPEEQSTVELAKAYKELKENSVPKEEFNKLQKEMSEVVATVINGGGGSGNGQATPTEKEKVDLQALRQEIYGPKGRDLNNLQVIEKTLKLRQAVIDQEGYDPFVTSGPTVKPTENEKERAELVAQVLQECVDECGGDSGVFTAKLQSKLSPDPITLTNHLKKLGIKYN